MTVRELTAQLLQMNPDAEVVFPDTYSRSEGWWPGCEDETCSISDVVMEDGVVHICGD